VTPYEKIFEEIDFYRILDNKGYNPKDNIQNG